jgi:hypothetical protein
MRILISCTVTVQASSAGPSSLVQHHSSRPTAISMHAGSGLVTTDGVSHWIITSPLLENQEQSRHIAPHTETPTQPPIARYLLSLPPWTFASIRHLVPSCTINAILDVRILFFCSARVFRPTCRNGGSVGKTQGKRKAQTKEQLRGQQRIPAHLLIQPASRKDGRRVKIPYMEENRTIVDQYGKVRTRSSQGKPSMRKNFITLPCRWGRGI